MRNLRQKGIMNSEKIFEMVADRLISSFQWGFAVTVVRCSDRALRAVTAIGDRDHLDSRVLLA